MVTTLERPELSALLHRSWRVVAYGAVGGEEPVSDGYTNTLEFLRDTNGNGTASTHGCIVETYAVTFGDDNTFVVGNHIGTLSACANPFDEGQHVDDALVEGATVRWSIGDGGQLTLTPTATPDSDVLYE